MERSVKARPAVLRALGAHDPPEEVYIDGEVFHRYDIYKHDSWAATAMYSGPRFGVVCKFNRKQPIGLISTSWLGRFLAHREGFAYTRLADVSGIIRGCGPVRVAGMHWPNAVAHEFMPGHPLGASEQVNDAFFPELLRTLQAVHARGFAYVDLHKRENIVVGEDGKPPSSIFRSVISPSNAACSGRSLARCCAQSRPVSSVKACEAIEARSTGILGLADINKRPCGGFVRIGWWPSPLARGGTGCSRPLGVRGKSGRSASQKLRGALFFRTDKMLPERALSTQQPMGPQYGNQQPHQSTENPSREIKTPRPSRSRRFPKAAVDQ
ncbi:MAG: hypothetical protein R3C12_16870 [Planctomycetaceae bacterium]